MPVLGQRHETQEAREMQQQDYVKVGIASRCLIQPSQGMGQILKQQRVLLLMPQGVIEELSEEKGHCCLGRFKRELPPRNP